jgi:drug/metabolite transporter (DMT)-like permease
LVIDGGTAAYQRILGGLLLTILMIIMRYCVKGLITSSGWKKCSERPTLQTTLWKQAWPWVIANGLCGPAIGVACFQWALSMAPTGIVLAIVATTPLVVIPFTWALDGERPHVYSLFGGFIAVSGAVALVLG